MLTLTQARHLQLATQGLLVAPTKSATPLALRLCIARMQLLQIDTINVVARSPYLVLHSRLGHYPTRWLDEALANAHVFETWAHEACLYPRKIWHCTAPTTAMRASTGESSEAKIAMKSSTGSSTSYCSTLNTAALSSRQTLSVKTARAVAGGAGKMKSAGLKPYLPPES